MEYTINNLSKIAGISTRTLRYYDEIGLLKPYRISSSGYRIYGEEQVNLLQQILFYKELEFSLQDIKEIINSENFDLIASLKNHKNHLIEKQEQISRLLNNIENTLSSLEEGKKMRDIEKFKGFKKDTIRKNEEKYGKEIREKYGDEAVEKSYGKVLGLSEKEFKDAEELSKMINSLLKEAVKTNNPDSDMAHEIVKLHKKWLDNYGDYNEHAHLYLGQTYVDDKRFRDFYETNACEGAAQFLRDSIASYYNAIFNHETYQWEIKK